MEITFYQNNAEPNRVDKTPYITEQIVMSGFLRDETSILNPVILIESEVIPNYNYCFISELNRYYYIDDIVSVRNGIWAISMSIDVLMSHKEKILNCSAFIDRNEKYSAPYSIDNERVIRQGTNIETYNYTVETAGYPNIILTDYDSKASFCIVLNGYRISAERAVE